MTAPTPGAWLQSLSSAERKEVAVSRGLFAYFPDALALIARHSHRSNEKHNPGEPLHWSREKSSDHEDCIGRHSIAVAVDPDSLDGGEPHIVCRAWRALAALQLWAEQQKKEGAEKPANDGWIHWDGIGPPPPGISVIRFRNGNETDVKNQARLRWTHEGSLGDIVAYRIVKKGT